jgi:hypothetical protein
MRSRRCRSSEPAGRREFERLNEAGGKAQGSDRGALSSRPSSQGAPTLRGRPCRGKHRSISSRHLIAKVCQPLSRGDLDKALPYAHPTGMLIEARRVDNDRSICPRSGCPAAVQGCRLRQKLMAIGAASCITDQVLSFRNFDDGR